jgi:hypothetical protein
MDLAGVKREYGDRLCLFGNVDNNGFGERHACSVEEGVKECILRGRRAGAMSGGPSKRTCRHTERERVAVYEAGRKYGRYPINV